MEKLSLKVLKVTQPIGEFFIGSIDSKALLNITHVDVREFREGNNKRIDGIQRSLSKSRVKSLREYVGLEYATFPTSVILAIDEKFIQLKPAVGCEGVFDLDLEPYVDSNGDRIGIERSAFVIDGQHRIAGLEARSDEEAAFEVNVSIFVGADVADQAEIFARVNLAQTKVNKSLALDLLEYAKSPSPNKIAHDLVVALNADEQGPMYEKIKRLGIATPGVDGETLSQSTVVNGLLRHLPAGQERERSKALWGLLSEKEPNESWKNRIFVEYYRMEDFASIFLIVSNYFDAVKKRWPDTWSEPGEGEILARTTGYNALMRFLKDCYLHILRKEKDPRVVKMLEFYEVFERINLTEDQLVKDVFIPGSGGQKALYDKLVAEGIGGQGQLFE